jgi:hypothetical protein
MKPKQPTDPSMTLGKRHAAYISFPLRKPRVLLLGGWR